MRIDAGGFQVGMAYRRRNERSGGAVVDGMRSARMAQPVDRCGGVDTGALAASLTMKLTARSVGGLRDRHHTPIIF